jgi:hypothetical protein
MAAVVTVNELLDGHVALDVECLDRIYLLPALRDVAAAQQAE